VGLFYADLTSLRDQFAKLAPEGKPGSKLLGFLLSKYPVTGMLSLRFEADRLVLDGINRAAPGAIAGSGKDSGLTKHVPGDSLVYAEFSDAGTFVRELVTALKQDPLFDQVGADTKAQIAQAEAFAGTKLENFLDWLGNLAIVGGLSDGQPAVGIVGSVTDEAVAKQRLTQLVAGIQFAAPGVLKVSQADHGGVQVTSIAPATGGATLPGGIPTSLSFAIKDGVLYLGLGEAFVDRLLDLKPEASLAQTQRFADALKAAGGPATSGRLWVDIASIRAVLEQKLLTGAQRDQYEKEYKPYLVPLDQFISVGVQDGVDQQTHTQFIVK
jgi:hypothetical protein